MTNPRAIEIEYTQVPSGTGEDGSLEGKALVDSAAHDAAHQHDLTIRQAIKYYRWAIFWCLAVRLAYSPRKKLSCSRDPNTPTMDKKKKKKKLA